jgi:rfaE bifunctional protein nucleotidyltransferase chain/domain
MIINAEKIEELRQSHSGRRIVFTDGAFDLLHLGHIQALKNLRNFGDVIVVGVMSDAWVKAKKGEPRPILLEKERLELIDSIRYVDYSVLLKDLATGDRIPTSVLLKKLRPCVFVSIDPIWEVRREEFENLGIKLEIVPRTNESSTTNLLARIRKVIK